MVQYPDMRRIKWAMIRLLDLDYRTTGWSQQFPVSFDQASPHPSTPTALQQTRPLGRGQFETVLLSLYDTDRFEKSLDAPQDSVSREKLAI